MTPTTQVLALDLKNLSEADLKWLHDLKNKAQALSGWITLKHAKENDQ